MRQFETGATRDDDQDKLDYEGFLSPIVLERFALYMHEHRIQMDGQLRDSDNWQKGIPRKAYMKSLLRHVMELWRQWRSGREDIEDVLCAIFFNVQGLLHESIKIKIGGGSGTTQANVYFGTHAGPAGTKLSSVLRGGEPAQSLGLLGLQSRRYGLPDPAYIGRSDPRVVSVDSQIFNS